MKKESQDLLDAYSTVSDFSLNNQRILLEKLNTCLTNCIQDLYENGVKFEDAELLEKLFFQIIYHNSSLIKLSYGSKINVRDKTLPIYDLSAIYSLARLQIETFINLSYTFLIECEYSKEIRIYVYKIQGLRKQMNLTSPLGKCKKTFEPLVKIRKELAKELFKLRKLEEYKKASKSEKKKFANPNYARLLKLEKIFELIEIGDLSSSHALYSNHIHAEYIGIRQLRSSIKNINECQSSISTICLIFNRITCVSIINLSEQYLPKENSFTTINSRLKKIIEITTDLSKKL